MKQIGQRIIYDKKTGLVLNGWLGQYDNLDIEFDIRPTDIGFIDLPYGDETLLHANEFHVDVKTKEIIVDSRIEVNSSYLELQQLLLQEMGII